MLNSMGKDLTRLTSLSVLQLLTNLDACVA